MSQESSLNDSRSPKSGRSRIRVLIPALTLAVFLVFGAVAFLLLFGSQNRMASKSKDELIQIVCEENASSARSLIPFLQESYNQAKTDDAAYQRDLQKILAHELTDIQRASDAQLKQLVDEGLMNLKYILVIIPPVAMVTTGAEVLVSNDESLVYNWEVPEELSDAIVGDTQYIYKKGGIPSLGIEKDGLYIIAARPGAGTPELVSAVAVTSIEDRVAQIDAFLNTEQKNSRLIFSLVMLGCLLVLFLITFVILSRLIRNRISKPIDDLTEAAADVMDGKLDVNVAVHGGGDFEVLEQAFKEMVGSVRMMIERSIGE